MKNFTKIRMLSIFIFCFNSPNIISMEKNNKKHHKIVDMSLYDLKSDIFNKTVFEQIKSGKKKRFVYNPTGKLFERNKSFRCPICNFRVKYSGIFIHIRAIIEHFINDHDATCNRLDIDSSTLHMFEIILPDNK